MYCLIPATSESMHLMSKMWCVYKVKRNPGTVASMSFAAFIRHTRRPTARAWQTKSGGERFNSCPCSQAAECRHDITSRLKNFEAGRETCLSFVLPMASAQRKVVLLPNRSQGLKVLEYRSSGGQRLAGVIIFPISPRVVGAAIVKRTTVMGGNWTYACAKP